MNGRVVDMNGADDLKVGIGIGHEGCLLGSPSTQLQAFMVSWSILRVGLATEPSTIHTYVYNTTARSRGMQLL